MRAEKLLERVSRRKWAAPAILVLAGAVAGMGHPPLAAPPAVIIGFAVAARMLAHARSWQAAARFGWLFAASHFAVVMIWVVEPFLVFPERHGWMAPLAVAALAGGLALFWSAGFAAAWALGSGPVSRAVALAVTTVAAEALREVVFTGFPWGLPGYAWSATPVAQLAALIGPLGLSFLTVLAAAALVRDRLLPAGIIVVISCVASLWVFGLARQQSAPLAAPLAPLVRLVQPDVGQDLKWDPDHTEEHYQRLLDLSGQDAVESPAVVVWPETAATFLLSGEDDRLAEISAAAGGMAVIGIRRYVGGRIFNSMAVIGPGGALEEAYDKRKLVPFGEYIPFGDFLARQGFSGLATDETGAFSAGQGGAIFPVQPLGRALAIICYEAIFWSALRREERPDVMIQVTNDAWFGSLSGPQQHLEQVRMRAIELGVPVLRAANTGITAAIDSHGNTIGRIELGQQGILDVRLPPPRAPTWFARLGHLPLLILSVLLAGLLAWRNFAIRR